MKSSTATTNPPMIRPFDQPQLGPSEIANTNNASAALRRMTPGKSGLVEVPVPGVFASTRRPTSHAINPTGRFT